MIETNTISLSELEGAERIDAEIYTPHYREISETLSRIKTIRLARLCSKVTQGPNPKFLENGYACVNGRNIKDNWINIADEQPNYVSKEEFMKYRKAFKVRKNDLLITLKGLGSIGQCGFAFQEFEAIFSRDIGVIRTLDTLDSCYVYVFMLTKYGIGQIEMGVTGGTGQRTLAVSYLAKMRIPVVPSELKKEVMNLLVDFNRTLNESLDCYSQAQTLLLKQLKLSSFEPRYEVTYVADLSKAFEVHRIDAEYFQPAYDHLIEYVRLLDHVAVKKIQEFNRRGVQPEYTQEGDNKVVTSKHLGKISLDYENLDNTSSEEWERRKEARVRQFDILIYTTGAYVGRTNCYLEKNRVLASNHINILRIKELNPIYVAVFLNSIVGQMQVKRLVSGSAQVELYPSDISKFVIWKAPSDVQQRIASLIQRSHEARKKAKGLLDEARTRVEQAIDSHVHAANGPVGDSAC